MKFKIKCKCPGCGYCVRKECDYCHTDLWNLVTSFHKIICLKTPESDHVHFCSKDCAKKFIDSDVKYYDLFDEDFEGGK